MKSYLNCWKRIFDFSGKGTVGELFIFILLNYLFSWILSFIISFFMGETVGTAMSLFTFMAGVASLSACVRALHGIGKSGWWALLQLIPCCGLFILIIILVTGNQTNIQEN